jgi:hypothetical protein
VHCWVLREHPLVGVLLVGRGCCGVIPPTRDRFMVIVLWVGGVGVVVFGLFFENYTVDASIFVVKLLRAYGGCLGIRSR